MGDASTMMHPSASRRSNVPNAAAREQRRAFIAAWRLNVPVADLARRFGVSRKTAYKFIARFQRLGAPSP